MTTADLFDGVLRQNETLADGALVLRGFARAEAAGLATLIERIAAAAPFRRMVTPGGFTMSAAMTNCGHVGWVTDRSGYRYDSGDPETGRLWPAMPAGFADFALRAAAAGGYANFHPDSCLINLYEPGARLSLHQDRNEADFGQPIVSVSLGLPAVFLFGGLRRTDATRRIRLDHGDVAVWGGPSRLAFHGVAPPGEGEHPTLGRRRINLTFRKAL